MKKKRKKKEKKTDLHCYLVFQEQETARSEPKYIRQWIGNERHQRAGSLYG
jgi:hypothetical protein